MFWNDAKITEWAKAGGLTPFDPDMVNPASLDLRLGTKVRRIRQYYSPSGNPSICLPVTTRVNKRTQPEKLWMEPEPVDGCILYPGECVLLHSAEYIAMPDDAVGMLFSKSSSGRLLFEHFHSGWFDPGFHGQATFEFKNEGPWELELHAGEPWVQLVMARMVAPSQRSYRETGRYNGQVGPEAHRL